MALYLADTNVLIQALRGRGSWPAYLASLIERQHVLASCPITIAEIHSGMRPHEEMKTRRLLESLKFCAIDTQTAALAGKLRQEYSARGKTLTLADALIAATAINHDCVLLTDNVKDFPMPELRTDRPPLHK